MVRDSQIRGNGKKGVFLVTSSTVSIQKMKTKKKANISLFRKKEGGSKSKKSLSVLKFHTIFWSYSRSNEGAFSLLTTQMHTESEYLGMGYPEHSTKSKVLFDDHAIREWKDIMVYWHNWSCNWETEIHGVSQTGENFLNYWEKWGTFLEKIKRNGITLANECHNTHHLVIRNDQTSKGFMLERKRLKA